MLAVLDTNVLLSALWSGKSPPAQIIDAWRERRFRLNDYLLAMALAAGADFLVTGDGALLALKRLGQTRIVAPARFAALLSR